MIDFDIIQKAWERLEQLTKAIPATYREAGGIARIKEKLLDTESKSTIRLYAHIISYIHDRTEVNSTPERLIQYTYLNILEYVTNVVYNLCYDRGQKELIPFANYLFKELITEYSSLGIDVKKTCTLELFMCTTQETAAGIVEPASLDIYQAIEQLGNYFTYTVELIRSFAGDYWAEFWKNCLLMAKMKDDLQDFYEDFTEKKVLNTYGVLAVHLCFRNKRRVNLKNPFTVFVLKYFILYHEDSLKKAFIRKWKKRVKRSGNKMLDGIHDFEACFPVF